MPKSHDDEIWATARLPVVDVDVLHRRPWDGGAEHLLVTVRVVPPLEAFSRLLELSNPLVVWTRMMEAAWSPWVIPAALSQEARSPSPLRWRASRTQD